MVDWKELQKQLSNGERKIEFITDDSSEYKVLRKRALELSDAEAEYWFGLWQEKVNFSSRMAGYYYEKAQKGGVKEASYALNRINGTLDDKTRDVIYQGRQDQSSKKEADVHAAQNVSPIWTIKEHDFNNAKKQIKKFSNEAARDLDIKLVDEKKGAGEFFCDLILGRGFGLAENVTGEDFNDRMLVVKKHLQNINDTQIKLTKEFGQVYNALEALDKDYIQAILISVKAAEKTSEGVKAAQENIEKLVNDQIRTLEILKKFKQKLDGYSHLEDVDKIWSDCQKWHLEITKFANELSLAAEQSGENSKAVAELESTVKILEERTNDLSKQLISMSDEVEAAKAYINILNEIAHLKDVDDMWTAVGNCSTQIDDLKDQYDSIADSIRKNKDDIDEFWKQNEDYQMRLNRVEQESKDCADKLKSVSHLDDIDVMWNDAKEHKIMLDKCEKRSEELTKAIQKNKEENKSITEAVQTTNEAIKDLIKKVKIAYWIAGGSAGLAVIELILLLMRVL